MPLPISGKRLAPKINMRISRMISISGRPMGPKSASGKLMSGSIRPHLAAILVILALTSAPSGALSQPDPQTPTFSSRITQVEVYATVTDRNGRAVKGLADTDFTVLEDDVPQKISTFVGGEFPAAVALAVDRSFSMKGTPLTMAKTAGRAFVGNLKPDDRVMLITISGDVEVPAPISSDRGPILEALESLDPWSTTSLNDALIQSLDLLEDEHGRRAIVVLSDGEDRYSTARESDVLNRARRSDVMMYPIAIGRNRPRLFVELAAVTGGRSFHLRDPKALQTTLQTIAEDLRAQYLIGYESQPVPASGEDGWRSITVHVNRPGLSVRARSGYSVR
jgi:Ca-activated chloride channel family protein